MVNVHSLPGRIALLNDRLRCTLIGGRIVMTQGIVALPHQTQTDILSEAGKFADFNEDNDPHGEHDCAVFTVGGRECMFKIDYYDKSLQHASEDPSDPEVTTRVLTIMLAAEY